MPVGKLRQHWDNVDEREFLTLRELLRPSLIALTICGCHKYEAGFCKTRKTYRFFETGYRIIFIIVCLAALVQSCAAFVSLPKSFVYFNGINTVWHLQNLIMFLVSLKSSHINYGGQTKAFEFWDTKIREELAVLGVEIPEERFRSRQKVVLCVAAILVIFNTTGTILLLVDVFGPGFGIAFTAPFSKTIPIQIMSCCILASQTLVWILPLGYIVVIATFLTMTFEELNKFLENLITENCFTMACEFRRIRPLHMNLSKMSSYIDKDFSSYFATVFVFNICLACFNLYQIVRTPMDTLNLLMTLFWMISSLTFLGIISVSAAILNAAVGIISRYLIEQIL